MLKLRRTSPIGANFCEKIFSGYTAYMYTPYPLWAPKELS